MKKLSFAGLAGVVSLTALAAESINLNQTAAVRDLEGNIIAYASQPGRTNAGPEKAFDGDYTTRYYPEDDGIPGTWCGIGFDKPYVITAVMYAGQTIIDSEWWGSERMKDCLIQGASTADFTDAETLAVLDNPERSTPTIQTSGAASAKAWQYVRIYGPNDKSKPGQAGSSAGLPVELVFFGYEPEPESKTPEPPVISNVNVINRHVWFDLGLAAGQVYAELEYRTSANGDWQKLTAYTGSPVAGQTVTLDLTQPVVGYFAFRAHAVNNVGPSDWTEHSLGELPNVLNGTCLGTPELGGNPVYLKEHVMDGDRATFCSLGTTASEPTGWVGFDFGKAYAVSGVRFLPPTGGENWRDYRSNFAAVEFANTPDFSDKVCAYDLPGIPSTFTVTTVTFDTPISARYARFRARLPNDELVCDLSELEFFTSDACSLVPNGLTASMQEPYANPHVRLDWAKAPFDSTAKIRVYRAVSAGGPWTPVALCEASATSWVDSQSPTAGVKNYYTLAYVNNETDEGPHCAAASIVPYIQLERPSVSSGTLREGCSIVYYGRNDGPESNLTNLFDGNPATYGDLRGPIAEEAKNLGVGIDFTDKVYVHFVRSNSHYDWQADQLDGVTVYASDTGVSIPNGIRASSDEMDTRRDYWWILNVDLENAPHRYWYIGTVANWAAYVGEIEFFGWRQSDVDSALVAPEITSITADGDNAVVRWENDCSRTKQLLLERRERNGTVRRTSVVTLATDGVHVCPARERPSLGVQSRYVYRLIACDGDERAYSSEFGSDLRLQTDGGMLLLVR